MMLAPEDIRARFDAHRAEHPRAWHRDVARALGVSEIELVAANAGLSARQLAPRWDELFAALTEIGSVKTITRNEACVLEKWGSFGPLERFGAGAMAQTLGEIDLRIFFRHWAALFAVEQPGRDGVRRSLQVFDRQGDSVQKIYLELDANHERYAALVRELALAAPEPVSPVAPEPEAERSDHEVDVSGLQTAWDAMRDTHEFFGLLRGFGVTRTQALRLAGPERASRIARHVIECLLSSASAEQLPIMIFVGSRGVIQIHTGPIEKVSRAQGYLNVLDPSLNLHLREELVCEAWVVRKPTKDGIVTSVELYDAEGETIALFFGQRKPGMPENDAWRRLAEATLDAR